MFKKGNDIMGMWSYLKGSIEVEKVSNHDIKDNVYNVLGKPFGERDFNDVLDFAKSIGKTFKDSYDYFATDKWLPFSDGLQSIQVVVNRNEIYFNGSYPACSWNEIKQFIENKITKLNIIKGVIVYEEEFYYNVYCFENNSYSLFVIDKWKDVPIPYDIQYVINKCRLSHQRFNYLTYNG